MMNKREFLERLRIGLSDLPPDDAEERLNFYSEMIDDRMEEGFSEEAAVSAVGAVDEIAAQITADAPRSKAAKEEIKPKNSRSAWRTVFLVLGSPVWLSLLIAAFAVIFSLYVSLWAVIVSLWAVFAAMILCALCCIAVGIAFAVHGNEIAAIAAIGAGLICAGASIFIFFGCKAVSRGAVMLPKSFCTGVKNLFSKKEGSK